MPTNLHGVLTIANTEQLQVNAILHARAARMTALRLGLAPYSLCVANALLQRARASTAPAATMQTLRTVRHGLLEQRHAPKQTAWHTTAAPCAHMPQPAPARTTPSGRWRSLAVLASRRQLLLVASASPSIGAPVCTRTCPRTALNARHACVCSSKAEAHTPGVVGSASLLLRPWPVWQRSAQHAAAAAAPAAAIVTTA